MTSGLEMPLLGLGTWRLTGKECVETVRVALELGYRHLDTADAYGNHREVGAGIRGFDRGDLFITSKVPPELLRYDDVILTCERNLIELHIEYLDLYLIHWPNPELPMAPTFEALAALVQQGKVRSIGVSNFTTSRLEEALDTSPVPICTNQVEFHPLLYQTDLMRYCRSRDVVVTAYAPLGRQKALQHPTVVEVAGEYGKTPAQICLRWLLQHDIAAIPKSSSEARLDENLSLFDWELSPEAMLKLDSIPDQVRLVRSDIDEF
jgi:diketogulonate reductase-like aldo/keto reductase